MISIATRELPRSSSRSTSEPLASSQRIEFDYGDPAGQRLGVPAYHRRLSGPEDDETAGAAAIRVDRTTQRRKDRRHRLRLVENESRRPGKIERNPRILAKPLCHERILEIDVCCIRKGGLCQRRLPDLPRAKERYGGKALSEFDESGSSKTLKH